MVHDDEEAGTGVPASSFADATRAGGYPDYSSSVACTRS